MQRAKILSSFQLRKGECQHSKAVDVHNKSEVKVAQQAYDSNKLYDIRHKSVYMTSARSIYNVPG